MAAQNSALSAARRKLETELEQVKTELEEALLEAKNADDRAKKATIDVISLFFCLIFLDFCRNEDHAIVHLLKYE